MRGFFLEWPGDFPDKKFLDRTKFTIKKRRRKET